MAFNPIWGTGFEMGSLPFPSSDIDITAGSTMDVRSTDSAPHTSTYGLFIDGSAWARVPVGGSQSELYQGIWIIPASGDDEATKVQFILSDGKIIDLRFRTATDTWDAYVDGVNVASGTITTSAYHHVQVYLLAGNSGQIITKINGTEDINYSGDTQPSASNTIEYCRVRQQAISGNKSRYDDWVFGDDGWPGDLRANPIESVGDTATEEWDLSAGADSWDLLDEVPPSDADYIYSTVNGERTIVELDAWDATDKTPEFVMLWARPKKDVAAAHQVKIIDDDGSNTNVGDAEDLETNYTYVYKLLPSAPDGFQWNDTKVDTLNLGVESVVV